MAVLSEDAQARIRRAWRKDLPSPRGPAERASCLRLLGSGPGLDRPDQEVEDSHLAELVTASREVASDRSQRSSVAVEIALVGSNEPERAIAEWSTGPWVVFLQIRLDDAVEHGDQRRALWIQRLRHLRDADSSDVREGLEQP